jgi:hypothetical protein
MSIVPYCMLTDESSCHQSLKIVCHQLLETLGCRTFLREAYPCFDFVANACAYADAKNRHNKQGLDPYLTN